MNTRGELRIDPDRITSERPPEDAGFGEMEIVVLYTQWSLAEELLRQAVALTAGLNARIRLLAVHTVPFPATFECQAVMHAHLVQQLIDLASRSILPVTPSVILARSRSDGFLFGTPPGSMVLVGSPKRLWRTAEERLARTFAENGHHVVLIHLS